MRHPTRSSERPANRLEVRVAIAALALAAGFAAPVLAAGDRWRSDPDAALDAARETGRFVLVDLYADWCGWCKVLEREVFTTDAFRRFATGFELLRVDVEDGAEGSQLQADYAVSSLPTMLILDGDGIRVGAVSGYFPAAQYIDHLARQVLAYEASLAQFDQVRQSDDLQALRTMAEMLHRRLDGKRAVAIYDRMMSLDPSTGERLLLLTMSSDALRLAGELDRARASATEARALAAQLEQPLLAEQAELLVAQIAHEAGDCDVAERAVEGFLRAHPKSPMRGQARQLLSQLRRTAACG